MLWYLINLTSQLSQFTEMLRIIIILLACFTHSCIKASSIQSLRLVLGKNKIIVVGGWFCWRQSNIKKYKINKLFAFQRFIRVKQHWYPPWEVTGSHVAERWTERPGGRYLLMDCLLQSFFTIHDILYYVLYVVWCLNIFHCSQVPHQTAEQRRDSALTFAREKARERFMERNGK